MMAWYNCIALSQEARFILALCLSLANTVPFFLIQQCWFQILSLLSKSSFLCFGALEVRPWTWTHPIVLALNVNSRSILAMV